MFDGIFKATMNFTLQFFLNYASIVISMFIKACRTLPELEYLCQRHYAAFRDPVVRGDVEQHNVRALYRYATTNNFSYVNILSIGSFRNA